MADHPIFWHAFVGGAVAEREWVRSGPQAPEATPAPGVFSDAVAAGFADLIDGRLPPGPWWEQMSDLELLQTACDAQDGADRTRACDEVVVRMQAGRCNAAVGLLCGGLRQLNPDALQQSRRAKLKERKEFYNLDLVLWY